MNTESLTNAELLDLHDRMQAAVAERERTRAEEEQSRRQEARRADAAREAERRERELVELTARHDRLAAVEAAMNDRIAETAENGPWHRHDDLVDARSALRNGLSWSEGGVLDERTGAVGIVRRPVVPQGLREALPDEDFDDFVSLGLVEARIAEIEARLPELRRRAA